MSVATSLPAQSPEAWRAIEMPPDHFNPYDVELPGIETVKIHGRARLGSISVEWMFESRAENLEKPPLIFPFFSGFGGIQFSSEPFSNAMAQLDMGTLTIEPIRKDDRSACERLFDPHAIQLEAMDIALEGLADATGIRLSSDVDGTKAVPLGHSMGGEPVIAFAEEHLKETYLAIMLATIGYGSPDVRSIAKNLTRPRKVVAAITEEFAPFLRIPEVPKNVQSLGKAAGYFILNPLRTVGEIGSCLTSDLTQRSQTLDENGVPVVYGQPVYDVLVQGLEGARNAVTVVSEIDRAGHLFVQAKPNRAAYWVHSAINTPVLADVA